MTYFDWLITKLIPDQDIRDSYQKVLLGLFNTDFRYFIKYDDNRAKEGEELREMYESETGLWCNNYSSCSVLEMLGALALRCETELMWDPEEGDRTSVWFWEMLDNMGLTSLDDWHFDFDEFEAIVEKLNNRTYDSDGYGGPFYIANFDYDMRKMELWYQMNYYIKSKYSWQM
jgi:hypothetical protein